MLQTPIAVIGVSALFPGSSDARGFWRDILDGRDLTTEVPPSHWLIEDYYDPDPTAMDKTYCKRGAFLPSVGFEPMAFGVPPSIMPATDTAQLLALIVAQKVLDDVGASFAAIDREKVSVILGVTSGQELLGSMVSRLQRPVWLKALRDSGLPEEQAQAICERISSNYVPWQEASFPGLLGNVVAGRIANRFDLHGTNCVTDAACASALSALSMGVNELAVGQSDLVITGGVDTMNDILMYMCFSKTPALSPTGDCRPFSSGADGTLLGEGIGMIALRRLEDAERDGNRIYGVLRGLGSSSDGRSKSVYAPLPEGQARAIRRAYAAAGYGPETVELVEAHGTATKAGDLAEFEGLKSVFAADSRADAPWCALGSVKSQIGHTKAAAGIAGLIKAVLAVHHKVLPPTIKVDAPNAKLAIDDSPFYLNTQARPWIRDASHPRRAAISSFGFGGSNFHVTIEEYLGQAERAPQLRTQAHELFLCAASSGQALAGKCRAQAKATSGEDLSELAYASQTAFRASEPARLAIVAASSEDLTSKLEQAAALLEATPNQAFSTPTGIHYEQGAREGSVAFLFPGQGSQYLGMGAELAMTFEQARSVWDCVAEQRFAGTALHDVVYPHPAFTPAQTASLLAQLTATEWAQPAIGATSAATLALLSALGVQPECVAGHSFGELTALFCAGVIDLSALIRLARTRGELMRDAASTRGAMLAVPLPLAEVAPLLKGRADLVLANHNHPTQVVVSGTVPAIEAFALELQARNVTAKRLQVATAFHSPLVAGASAHLATYLADVPFAEASLDVYSNAEAAVYPAAPAEMKTQLAAQLARPVRFVEQIEAMWLAGVRTFIEVGPGSVLVDFVQRTLTGRPYRAIATDRAGRPATLSFLEAVGRMSVAGLELNYAPLWLGRPAAQTTRPKSDLTIAISGANHGKLYPPQGAPVASLPLGSASVPRNASTASASAVRAVTAPPAGVAPTQTNGARQNGQGNGLGNGAGAKYGAHSVPLPQAASVGGAAAKLSHATPMPVASTPPSPLREPALRAVPLASSVEALQPAPTPEVHAAWLQAYQETQRSLIEAQSTYQRVMAESHLAFLQTVDSSNTLLTSVTLGNRLAGAGAGSSEWLPPAAQPHVAPSQVAAPQVAAPQVAVPQVAVPQVVSPQVVPAAPAMVAPTVPSSGELESLMLSIVAEKTGYPASMLGLQMELEADLGVDSIKRVEILSALRERAPGLPEVVASELAALRTLGEIVDYMRARMGAPAAAAAAITGSMTAAAPASSGISSGELESLMLSIVAEKTGYPSSMLGLQMELEADLGVDSIKRVEILSALRERAPGLPEVVASELAALRTLGEIVDYMRARSGGPAVAAPVTPAAQDDVAVSAPAAATQRWVVHPVEAQRTGLALAGLRTVRRLVVTDDGTGVAPSLVAALKRRGIVAELVSEAPADADGVIFLGGLRAVTQLEDALAINHEAFRNARAAAASIAQRGLFVAVQDTGGDFGLSGREPVRAWLAGVAALARTAALEWPDAAVKCIDIARGDRTAVELAEALAQELTGGGSLREVGLSAGGARVRVASTLAAAESGVLPVSQDSVLVVSGGARGVTAAALTALVERTHARVVLLGRTQREDEPESCQGVTADAELKRRLLADAHARGESIAPAALGQRVAQVTANREIRRTLDALTAAGGKARYLSVDVQDTPALSRALSQVRADWGPVTGVVHAAGVLADKLIADKTPEQFARVFATKVDGLRALLEATSGDPLTVIALFSSVAARTGNPGQCDYAMANEVLNAVACAERVRRAGACVVKSIGWGPWESGMVTPALKARFEQQNVPLLSLRDGAARFVDELAAAPEQVVTVIGGELGQELGASGETRCVISVDRQSYDFLEDHRVASKVVVPVVLTLDWIVRAARDLRPDLRCIEVSDLKVMRGIKLDQFGSGSEQLALTFRARPESGWQKAGVELRGRDGVLHYTAVAVLGEHDRTLPEDKQPEPKLEAWSKQTIYDGRVLFHGPKFQAIRAIEGVSASGLIGRLVGTRELGWARADSATDLALLDGALQLATLWAKHVLHGATLPMAVKRYRSYRHGLVDHEVRAIVRSREVHPARAVADVALLDGAGTLIAELLGVENVLRPDEAARPEGVAHAL